MDAPEIMCVNLQTGTFSVVSHGISGLSLSCTGTRLLGHSSGGYLDHMCRFLSKRGKAGVLRFYSRKQTKLCRSTFSAELASVDDGVSHFLLMQGMVNEVMHGPFRAEELEWLINSGRLPVRLQLTTDNQGLFATLGKEELKVPAEPHLIYLLRALKAQFEAGTVDNIGWTDMRDMIGDMLTKSGLRRLPILEL